MDKGRVVIITNIPNPYRVPLFNTLARQLEATDLELVVIFGAAGYSRRKFKLDLSSCGFEYHILRSGAFHLGDNEKTMFNYPGLLKRIGKLGPDVIFVTGYSMATLKLWIHSFFNTTPYFIWSGSVVRRGRFDSALRLWFRKLMMRRASGFVAYGSRAATYLKAMGAPPERVHTAINTVDTDYFLRIATKNPGASPNEKKRLLTIGYLVPRKQTVRLLEVIRLLARKRSDFILEIIGDGEDKPALEAFVRTHKLEGHVVFQGFRQKEELPAFLSAAYCFLFQTDFDIWGLVLNEAMASGLPCIASPNAGATEDLVVNGKTGYVVDFSVTLQAAKRIEYLLDHPEEARAMGRHARDRIREQASLKVSAQGFIDAIRTFQRS